MKTNIYLITNLFLQDCGRVLSTLYWTCCNDLNSRGGLVTWQELLHIARHPERRVPMAIFSQLAHTLHRYSPVKYNISSLYYRLKEYLLFLTRNNYLVIYLMQPNWTVPWSRTRMTSWFWSIQRWSQPLNICICLLRRVEPEVIW